MTGKKKVTRKKVAREKVVKDEGIVISSKDSDSFTKMREIQAEEIKVAQIAARSRTPRDQVKVAGDDTPQQLGRPGPTQTRGEIAKQEAQAKKEARLKLQRTPVAAASPAIKA